MRAASLTPLLLRVRDAGLAVRVDGDDLVVTPRFKLTPEIRADLLRHKPELVELLAWNEKVADDLLKDAFAYLKEFFIEDPETHMDAVNEAFDKRDMFGLRIAVREWVSVRVAMFRATERDRGTAA